MGINKRLIHVLGGIAVSGLCLPPTLLTSCAQAQHIFVFVSQSADVIETTNQDVWIKLKYVGHDKIDCIQSIRFMNSLGDTFTFASETENIPLDENNEFSFSIRLKNEFEQIQNLKLGFILLYQHDEMKNFDTVDNIDIQLDSHEITFIRSDPQIQTMDNYIEYKFSISGIIYPTQIDEVSLLGENVDKLELLNDSDIPIDDNHNFSIWIRTKNISSPSADELDFQIQTSFTLFDSTIVKNSNNCSLSYFYPNIKFISQSSIYLVKQDQLVDFIFEVDIPSPEKVTKIDKVDVTFKDWLGSGGITLLNDTDIPVDNNNEITLTFRYDEIEQKGLADRTTFYFVFDFVTSGGIQIINYVSAPCNLIAYADEPYSGNKVKIIPLSNCEVSIINSNIEFDEGDYNIQYSIAGGEPQTYETPEAYSEGQKISLKSNESIEFFNDTNQWSRSDGYLNFKFSAPVIITGDVTSLLDGTGGQITEFTGSNVFDHLFYGANVIKVSSDFLKPTKLGRNAYHSMFAASNLLAAPELPATTIQEWCYQEMFSKCKKLQVPPSILPVEILPASAYDGMFSSCTSLTYTPIIKAKSINPSSMKPSYALRKCFSGCSSLKEIYIPDWEEHWFDEAYKTFDEWVKDVREQGIFYYNGSITDERGVGAIPEGWEIKEWHN